MRIAGHTFDVLIKRLHSLFVVDSPHLERYLIGLAQSYSLEAIVAGIDEDLVAAIAEGKGKTDHFRCDLSHKISDACIWAVCEDMLETIVLEADVCGTVGELIFCYLFDDVSCLLSCNALLDLDVRTESELLTEG